MDTMATTDITQARLYATPRLAEKRQELGYLQQEMADILGLLIKENLSLSLYQKWEQGRRFVPIRLAVAISRELEIDIKELWSNDPRA